MGFTIVKFKNEFQKKDGGNDNIDDKLLKIFLKMGYSYLTHLFPMNPFSTP